MRLPQQASTWWAVVYMIVIGSRVVFTLYVVVLQYWDASRANYGFLIVPIVTILISACFSTSNSPSGCWVEVLSSSPVSTSVR